MIRLDRVSKVFGPITAVDAVTMEVAAGEVCVLLGPSGCGKTTTMKMINRLIPPTSGKIFLDGRDTDLIDEVTLRRSIGYVIQQIGLFPNMTVEDNICVVPDLLRWDRTKSRRRAAELLEMVNLDPKIFLKRYPKELSGGQQQRVGVVRALAADPPVLLMDEPFGAIDPINREVIQDEFMKLQEALRKTVVFVSHDIDEAVKMGSRIAIFRDGRLIQYDTPNNVLAKPADPFVADFVGSDRTLKRLRLVKVSEAMMPDPPRVRSDDTLDTAVRLMEEHGHISIVMVGPRGRARGVVRLDTARGRKGLVGENIEPLPGTVNVTEDLRTAVSLMFTHDVAWLACVDDDGFYKGYVTQRGITHTLGAAYRGA
ncbi:MAG TPA: ABC transporter ATP-binding protein [Beijerinckiaceae bacterium]